MSTPRILIVGGGFAGLECAYRLERRLTAREAEITMVSEQNHQLYLPLLPQVAAGKLTAQSIAVSLRRLLRRTTLVPGRAVGVDPAAKAVVVRTIDEQVRALRYDYLVLAPGSVTRQFDIPGVAEHAIGMKTLAEAAYLRDHVIGQLDLAAATDDPEERAARLRFVVVGGGYAGSETAAYVQRLTSRAAKRYPGLDASEIRCHLVDLAPKLMPELGDALGRKAVRVLERRGVEMSLGVSVASATEGSVTLTDGRTLPCRTLVWTAGVAPSPLIATLDAETERGRLVTRADLTVPGFDGVYALGDAASVPDLATGADAVCAPTAQHATRQGKAAAMNVLSAIRGFPGADYRHRDLGLVVDLGGAQAVARPLGVPLSGIVAQGVTTAYHLMALRTLTARSRAVGGWLLNALAGDDYVRIGLQAEQESTLDHFESRKGYLSRAEVRELTDR
ncbi:NAD(P)/FAD-dependent oxidoreductase [Streptomyces sp. NBC_00237]|uniref:NAD(P)/FAD-dependent oxidoreductase n=1 Tax=Streptomyces sp. NBC_00237 TaxID=2975687 RepID=UPI002257BB71|nr:NAD(P)/FAD-dependent oxidoreductase [Streptomyces sp. NBC_00237]MCX5206367.1 NAD(P)/FAD-dependent oxidoreductase [Streptomyces sp. NBC_00237]